MMFFQGDSLTAVTQDRSEICLGFARVFTVAADSSKFSLVALVALLTLDFGIGFGPASGKFS